MAGAKEIKGRIKSIQSTRQITKAMEIVSTTKFKKFSQMVIKSRAYEEGIKKILRKISYGVRAERHPLFDGREEIKKIAIIVFSADRGLCGGFNTLISKECTRLIAEQKAKAKENKIDLEIELISLGRKSIEYANKNKIKMAKQFFRLNENVATSISTEISKFIVDEYNSHNYDEVYIIYNKFISALRYDLISEKILPISRIKEDREKEEKLIADEEVVKKINNYIFEPSAEIVLSELLPRFINVQIFQAMLNNMASEHSARKNAMTNATENADEMIRDLNLDYNRKRQASITQEITEIVGGASTL